MKPIKIYICEDEEIHLKINYLVTSEYLKKKHIEANMICRNSYQDEDEELLKSIELAILDIDLGEHNGIQLAKKMRSLNPDVVIIFITAHKGYSLEAAQIYLSGFLMKPLDPFELNETLQRAMIQVNGSRSIRSNRNMITFHNGKTEIREKFLISIEKMVHTRQVEITTTKNKFQINETIKHIEQQLSDSFVKLNRSVIVNLSYIHSLDNNTVRMNNGVCYQISTRQMNTTRKAYADFVAKN